MTRTEAPCRLISIGAAARTARARTKVLGGRLDLNLARTTPLLPWGRVTLPQMTRILEPRMERWAR